ncbi:hypothetical protein [Jiella sp. KSK16Y-1]|uniref:Uncharacterized protein n=1 Tax=Jiella mangrovi TaxID=2821407 RepID=A0ABS4BHW1_9HYPH|nr:hypothetical protein [Jiella mangrovi]
MGRSHLAHATGDAANAVLVAVGYSFRRILIWLKLFASFIQAAILTMLAQGQLRSAA